MNFQDILKEHHDFFLLPNSYDNESDIQTFFTKKSKEYLDILKSISESSFQVKGIKNKITTTKTIEKQTKFIKGISDAFSNYLNGYPEKAYRILDETLKTRTDTYSKLFETLEIKKDENFYRIRLGESNKPYKINEMFHIPFHLRTKVTTQRYSISGYPSLYIGKSVYTAWEELNRPTLNQFQVSRISNKEKLSVIDLTPQIKKTLEIDHKAYRFIITWPLVFACSIKVLNPQDSFKPEYIIPQLLLQWVRNNRQFDGIKYLSTHIELKKLYDSGDIFNLVLPVKESNKSGYCSTLKNKFEITNPISQEIKELMHGNMTFLGNKIDYEILDNKVPNFQIIKDMNYGYGASKLGGLQQTLDSMKLFQIED